LHGRPDARGTPDGVVLLVTGFVGICPLYRRLRIRTWK